GDRSFPGGCQKVREGRGDGVTVPISFGLGRGTRPHVPTRVDWSSSLVLTDRLHLSISKCLQQRDMPVRRLCLLDCSRRCEQKRKHRPQINYQHPTSANSYLPLMFPDQHP